MNQLTETFSNKNDSMNIIDFCNSLNIKWFPIILKIKNNKKMLCPVNHPLYKRLKEDGTDTNVPHYKEFKTISDANLKARQELFYSSEIMKYVNPSQLLKIAMDTSEYFQIDIDTENINERTLYNWIQNADTKSAYYKSLTKSYGYHIFIKIDGFHDFVKNYTNTKYRFQFKENYARGDGEIIQIFDDKENGVELLTGQWAYSNCDIQVFNKSNIIKFNERELPFFTDLLVINKKKDVNNVKIEVLNHKNRYEHEEIYDHMNNIGQEYIDNRATHFKIICSLCSAGYDNIALDCMYRSSNTKDKNLDEEFLKFQKTNDGTISIKTLFWYSKKSDEKAYFSLLKKHRGITLREDFKKELLYMNYITDKVNQRFIPYSIVENIDLKTDTITHIKSHLGSGKTTIIKNFIKNNPSIKKIIYFAPRVLFARDIYNDLKDVDFKLYSTLKKDDYEETDKIIIQLESTWKVKRQKYDLIVIDEVESVLKQLVSKDTNKNIVETYKTFEYILKNCNTIITADAFLSNNSIEVINSIKQNAISRVIVNDFNPYKRKAYEVPGFINLLEKMTDQVNNKNERVVFVSLLKGNADFAYDELRKKCPNKKIKYYNGQMSEKDKKFDNIEKEWSDVDILIYTPIITCGVNYDPDIPTFHSLYLWISPNSCCIRDLFQASLRVRKLINNECYFAFNYKFHHSEKAKLISKIFEDSEGNLLNIYKNLIEKQELLVHMGVAVPQMCLWGIKNLAYYIFEDYVSNTNCAGNTHEYMRLCGYEIYPLEILPTFDESDDNGQSSCAFGYCEIESIDFMEYRFYEKDVYNLSDIQKYQMIKYKFDKLIKRDELLMTDMDLTPLFGRYYKSMDILTNIVGEIQLQPKKEITIDSINDNNLNTYDLLINTDFIKTNINNDIKSIFNCDNLLNLTYSSVDIKNNLDSLSKVIQKGKHIYNFRTKQGNDEWDVKYINSCLKHIVINHLGLDIKYKRKKINKKAEYIYDIDLSKADRLHLDTIKEIVIKNEW